MPCKCRALCNMPTKQDHLRIPPLVNDTHVSLERAVLALLGPLEMKAVRRKQLRLHQLLALSRLWMHSLKAAQGDKQLQHCNYSIKDYSIKQTKMARGSAFGMLGVISMLAFRICLFSAEACWPKTVPSQYLMRTQIYRPALTCLEDCSGHIVENLVSWVVMTLPLSGCSSTNDCPPTTHYIFN